jgi:hypothetical protein
VQIGCNDLQGADLSRRLLHGSVSKLNPIRSGFDRGSICGAAQEPATRVRRNPLHSRFRRKVSFSQDDKTVAFK